jgi:acyl-CoA thioesterase FadM
VWAEHLDDVRPEWLDANGHMNLAYYVVVFDRGTDAWLDLAGLGAAYRETGMSVFAVETHTLYRREVGEGAALHVRSRLVSGAGKRLHIMHEMTSAGSEVALQEILFLHVDLATRRPVTLGIEAEKRVRALAPPDGWEPPVWLGRRVGQPR